MKKQSDLSRLFAYAGKYKYLTVASWILSALSALLALLPFLCIWRILRAVLEAAPDYGRADISGDGWAAVGFALLSMAVYIAALMCSHLAAFRVQANIRSTAMRHIVTLPMGFLDSFGSGRARKIVNESSEATESYLAHQLPDRCGALATPVGLLAMLLFFDWRLGLLSLIPVAAAFLIMATMTGARMRQKMTEYQNALEQMSNEAVEYVRGIPVVKTFGQSVFSFRRFKGAIDQYEKWAIAYTKEMRLPMMFYTVTINGVFAVLIAAALVITGGQKAEPEFLLNLLFYIIITPVITVTLNKMMYASENEMIVHDALERIDTILEQKPLPEPERGEKPAGNAVSLRDVSFRYPGAERDALTHVSMEIGAGEHVALVGPSGSGKTTLASLIARFFDVSGGAVRIGGTDVRNMRREELMNTVSFVFQDSRLIKGSILDNVRMARPQASEREVEEALRRAQCGDILDKLPDGIHTVIGSEGVYLSGGEQQRIAIARVMLRNAPILILDEATAFADPDNERRVQEAFRILSEEKTVIMIAHRLTTVTGADRIFVLRDGELCETGSHGELVAADGYYARSWEEYHRAANWKVRGADKITLRNGE
ncbi:MAG: ABC transporter ATP-binding protein [Eubacteriales bacterium]|nr:ABC transporter ATP-binding protein [Eubacteriales bacterium]